MNKKQAAKMQARLAAKQERKDKDYEKLQEELRKAGLDSDWLEKFLMEKIVTPIVKKEQERFDTNAQKLQTAYETSISEMERSVFIMGIAAAMLAMQELTATTKDGRPTKNKWGADRCCQLAAKMTEILIRCIDKEDLLNEVLDRVGVQIDFSDPLEPITICPAVKKKAC